MTSATASVIICAYTLGRWSQIEQAVQSVLGQGPRPDQVLLVVDHCPELERRAMATFRAQGVTVVTNGQRRGLSGARNTGVSAATGEVIVFLDDDARAEPGWLAAHLACYQNQDVIGVGGLVVPDWETGPPRWFPDEFGWVVGCSYVGQPTSTSPVRNPIGANMSFRRAVFEAAGGFSDSLGRLGAGPTGCEETELSIRAAKEFPEGRILHEPGAVVRHHVSEQRTRWVYFRRRCFAEGQSKARVSSLADPRRALASERGYVLRTLPAGVRRNVVDAGRRLDPSRLARAAAICAGLAITTAGYVSGRSSRTRHETATTAKSTQGEPGMNSEPNHTTASPPDWIYFDIHQRLGLRVEANAPGAAQLRTMMSCFVSGTPTPPDITITIELESLSPVSDLEDQLRYSPDSCEFVRERVQIVRDGDAFRIHGAGELLTTLIPVLDRAMVQRGAGMIHAATVGYRGHAIALPAAGGTGKTSTVAKLMKRPGFSFMGDDWAFLADDKTLLGYEKPMFIKPHHRDIYPHMFEGLRKPMVPVALSRPIGRLTTAVHPMVIKYPRLADFSRRWSPEHRMVDAAQALPGVPVTRAAPLLLCVYLERHDGERTEITETTQSWMVDRMFGNFHIEAPGFSQDIITALAATSVMSWRQYVQDKLDVLTKAVDGLPCYLLQVPARFSPDQASDEVVRILDDLLPSVLPEPQAD